MTRSVVALLLLSILSLSFLSSSSAAVCGGAGYDLSSITYTDLSWVDTAHSQTWYFHPCGNVTQSLCQTLESSTPGGVMMCQLPNSGPPGYAVSTWVPESTQDQTSWTPYFNNGNRGVRMVLQDGAPCGSTPRRLTVNYQCSQSQPAGIAQLTLVNETSVCNYVATVLTSATCAGPSSGNGQVACGTTGLDLSSITTTDLIYKDTRNNYTYYFRPCGVVQSPQCANNPYGDVAGEAMMCQATGLNGEFDINTYDLAWWNPALASWRRFYNPQYPGAQGWVMSIKDGVSCGGLGSREVIVNFICAATYTTPVMVAVSENSTCTYSAVVLTSAACAQAPIADTTTESCGGQYDLTFATQKDLIYQPQGSTQYFVFRPCGIVDNAVCQRNANTNQSMMCQAYQGSTTTYDLAIYNPAAVSYSPTLTGLQMYIQDGDLCGTTPRSLTVNFVCQQGPPNSIAFTNLVETSTCNYVATVATSAVCRTGRQNGICGSQNYDFSLKGNTDYAYLSPDGAYTYYFNPCGQVNSAQCNLASSTQVSMMCQAVNGAATTYDIAYYDGQLVTWLKTVSGMQMFVQDGQSCNIGGKVYDRALTVNFICSTGSPVFNNLTESATTPCSYTAYVSTPQACAPIQNGGGTGIDIPAQPVSPIGATQCGGPYNLSPLSSSDLVYYPANQEYKWTLRVCGAVTSDANCTAAAAANGIAGGYMLCQDSEYGYGAYEASTWNPYSATWTPTRNGVLMVQADGAMCGAIPRTTRIYFTCDSSATSAKITNITEISTCVYNVVVNTNLVCPTGPQTCGGAGYDLSALTTRGDLQFVDSNYNWYFSPCGTVVNSQCQANENTQAAMMCQASKTSNTTYNVAAWIAQDATWTQINNGVQMFIQDGGTCDGGDYERSLTAQFLCGQGGGYSMNVTEVKTCQYLAIVNTGLACNQVTSSSSSSLSGGAIAGIVIGVVVGAAIILAVILVLCCGASRGFSRSKKSTSDYGSEGKGATGSYGDLEPSQSGVEMETGGNSEA